MLLTWSPRTCGISPRPASLSLRLPLTSGILSSTVVHFSRILEWVLLCTLAPFPLWNISPSPPPLPLTTFIIHELHFNGCLPKEANPLFGFFIDEFPQFPWSIVPGTLEIFLFIFVIAQVVLNCREKPGQEKLANWLTSSKAASPCQWLSPPPPN